MFCFDKDMFFSASSKINDTISNLSTVQSEADELVALSSELEGIDISSVGSDINTVKSSLDGLNVYIANTTGVIEEIEEGEGHGGFSYEPEEDWEELLIPTSPFSLEIDGVYGGRQAAPYDLFSMYMNSKQPATDEEGAMIGWCPTPTEDEQKRIDKMIELFNNKGITDENVMLEVLECCKAQACGHTVLTNWICEYYSDKPEEFESKFGYPLYAETNCGYMNYNYEVLLTDIYLDSNDQFLSDNVTEHGFELNNQDSSLHPDQMGDEFNSFTGLNAQVDVVTHDASVETYQRYMDEGYDGACIAAYRFDMDPHGCTLEECEDSYSADKTTEDGHWMTITGVSDNNNLILSSWGSEFELTNTDLYAKFPVDGVQYEDRDDECMVFIKFE